MSGSGGYFKYRCKYWLTYNCPNWVWVNNAPCENCLADGRDSDNAMSATTFHISREVYVPRFDNGSIHYTIMNVIANSDFDSGWAVRDLSHAFQTSSGPEIKAMNGDENLKGVWAPSI